MNAILADARWDSELRQLAAADTMPGWVRLAYTREPEFTAGIAVEGTSVEIMIVEDDRLVGMGTRALKPAYVNGVPQPLDIWGDFAVGRNSEEGALFFMHTAS